MENNLIEISKNNYKVEKVDFEAIITGCYQRIANATELTAKNYIQLQDEYNRLKQSTELWKERYYKMYKQNSSLKGQITKLKKKLNNL
jgi:fibronectin type 3 domain-containing protein